MSRTPPSESFSYDEKHHHKRRYKSLPCRGLENDVMSKALNQISKSPFTLKIEGKNFLGVSINPRSPSTIAGRTL